jgi:hypothetical protein
MPIAQPKDQAHELATEIGASVLMTLRKAAAEGRLPEDLASLSKLLSTAPGDALEPRAGVAAAPAPPKPQKRAPGTQTIRVLLRGARDMAQAPPGSELARYRIALLVLILCLTMLAGALAFSVL